MLSLLHFFCLFLLWGTGVGTPDTSLPYMVYLDGNQMVCLHWGFDDLQGDIEFQLTVNTTGWVGFGLSPNGNMIAADIVIGGMGPSEPYFTVSGFRLFLSLLNLCGLLDLHHVRQLL